VVVPAAMELLGSANWWLPRSRGRILPEIRIEEGAPPAAADACANGYASSTLIRIRLLPLPLDSVLVT
jgi:uncharacterized membrane protein YdfJ with MMPL/SSD domain